MCNNCIHKAVCSKFAATGGHVRECGHFREDRRGKWEIHQDSYGNELMWCRFCHSEFYDGENDTVDQTPNYCPNCGADMRGAEDGK